MTVLSHTAITDSGLEIVSDLPALRVVTLVDTSVTDKTLPHLARLELNLLSLRGRAVSARGLAHLDPVPLAMLVLPSHIRLYERRRLLPSTPDSISSDNF